MESSELIALVFAFSPLLITIATHLKSSRPRQLYRGCD